MTVPNVYNIKCTTYFDHTDYYVAQPLWAIKIPSVTVGNTITQATEENLDSLFKKMFPVVSVSLTHINLAHIRHGG